MDRPSTSPTTSRSALGPVRDRVVDAGRRITDAAPAGDAPAALDALRAMRVLCAHRRGPYGVTGWTAHIERWLAEAIDGYAAGGPWYVGRPLLVTANDYALRLYNGDTGVIVAPRRRRRRRLRAGGTTVEISPRRISAVDTVHAMTIHKSQGSQFDAVAVVLPDPTSPILTRELLYTAVDPGPAAPDRGRHGGEHPRRGRPPDRPGHRPARAALGLEESRPSRWSHATGATHQQVVPSHWRATCCGSARKIGTRASLRTGGESSGRS